MVNNEKRPKILIIGPARWGKDSLGEIFRDYFNMTFISSSQAASDIFLFEQMKTKYGYKDSIECFEDRVNHRQEWYEAICEYNKDDRARLAKGILSDSDCYVGMRDRDEIQACIDQGLFDLIIWVDAGERLEGEPATSFNIDKTCADIIIENNGTYKEFKNKAIRLGRILFGKSTT